MSVDQFKDLHRLQDGRCFICEQPMEQINVDHCHDSNVVRGLLCKSCNTGLGNFKDDIKRLRRAITYLMLPVTSRVDLKRLIIKLVGDMQPTAV